MFSLFWQLVTDPGRFAIDHWPSILVVAFLISCIWLLPTYMALLKSRVTWLVIGAFLLAAGSWSIRGRWDDDQFEKERAGFRDTLAQIEEAQQQAIIDAQNKVRAQEVAARQVIADALVKADADRHTEKLRSDRLQKLINAMPDTTKCNVDPVLREILKRGSQ